MTKIHVNLNTASTIRQGMVIKGGRKLSDDYRTEAACYWLNTNDYERLLVPEKVKISTSEGDVTVFAREDDSMYEGEIFIPRGPWANVLISSDTFCTGSPYYKGMDATVECSDEEVLGCKELFEEL
jgi:formylmethanofuran dehydrogenase subunit D